MQLSNSLVLFAKGVHYQVLLYLKQLPQDVVLWSQRIGFIKQVFGTNQLKLPRKIST